MSIDTSHDDSVVIESDSDIDEVAKYSNNNESILRNGNELVRKCLGEPNIYDSENILYENNTKTNINTATVSGTDITLGDKHYYKTTNGNITIIKYGESKDDTRKEEKYTEFSIQNGNLKKN